MAPTEPKLYTGTDDAGTQWLLTVWPDAAEIATRRHSGETWSAPVMVKAVDIPAVSA